MSDLISRQAAINALIRKRKPVNNGDGSVTITVMTDNVIKETLESLPSAQPEPQWIPCSERLPKWQIEVVVSCCDDAGDFRFNYTACGWMTRNGEYWIVNNEINYYVTAWMPLPEPYKEEEI